MLKPFLTFVIIFLTFIPPAQAEDLLIGAVERLEDGIVHVTPAPDRQAVNPEELVKIQSRIPGIDEIVESGTGYITETANETLQITVTDGEPALGDEVILLKGKFLNGSAPTDEEKWRRIGHDDIVKALWQDPPNAGAVCTMAHMYMEGKEVEKDEGRGVMIYHRAMKYQPPADCAAEYGLRLLTGDQVNKPTQWDRNIEEGFKWIEYAADRGSYKGIVNRAMNFETSGDSAEAKKWFKKAIEIEPEEHKGKAQEIWDALRAQK